jgi:hypothetical protein
MRAGHNGIRAADCFRHSGLGCSHVQRGICFRSLDQYQRYFARSNRDGKWRRRYHYRDANWHGYQYKYKYWRQWNHDGNRWRFPPGRRRTPALAGSVRIIRQVLSHFTEYSVDNHTAPMLADYAQTSRILRRRNPRTYDYPSADRPWLAASRHVLHEARHLAYSIRRWNPPSTSRTCPAQ